MSRVLVTTILTYCDVCKYDGRLEIPANPDDAILFEIQGRPKRVDVCEQDRNPSWETITACMIDDIDPERKAVAKVSTQRAPADMFPCPACGKEYSGQGVAMHLSRMHKDIAMDERQRLYAETVGIDNVSKGVANKIRATTPCPVNDCPAVVNGPQGVRMHLVSIHPRIGKTQREKYISAAMSR